MKSQQGFIVLGGAYFLIAALLVGGVALTDATQKKSKETVATHSQDSSTPHIVSTSIASTLPESSAVSTTAQ
ncbi:MAG: hypothetical protein U0997_15615 [Sulfurimicrobium sp.]|nr:hypothetical protein [Sulfurimicrobium sp.]